jgi:hypothetical protein
MEASTSFRATGVYMRPAIHMNWQERASER